MYLRTLFTGFILGIIGAFFGSWFSYLFGERKRRKEQFNKSAAAFKTAFLPELIFLKHNAKVADAGVSNNLDEFLRHAYLRHLRSLELFRACLSDDQRTGIEKVWKEYCCQCDDADSPHFEQYSTKTTGRKEADLKASALNRIEAIFKFAEHR